ncbi:MAG: glutathione S-transferase family protein [Betaproteobacteria bacterium]|nr:glutathione S-transferase family protein [Betaproteobacteria bacterium]
MKLYTVVGSPNCRKVLAVINHLGIKVDIEYLDFFAGDLMSPDYGAVNPNRMVPALRDGKLVLWESNAIMQYLADKTPGNTIFPRDPAVRADVVRWQCWELAHYNKAFGLLAYETVLKPNFLKQETNRELVRWAQEGLARFAPVLDAHMKGRQYAVGNEITLADYSLIHVEGFTEAVPFDWAPYPNLNLYYERMRVVPHWANTAPPSADAMGRRPKAA